MERKIVPSIEQLSGFERIAIRENKLFRSKERRTSCNPRSYCSLYNILYYEHREEKTERNILSRRIIAFQAITSQAHIKYSS